MLSAVASGGQGEGHMSAGAGLKGAEIDER